MSHRELLRQWAVPDDFDPALNEPEVRFQAAHVRQQHPELSSVEAHERALARIIYQAWAKHRKEPTSVYQAVDDKIGVLRKRIVKYAAVTVGVILLWLILLTVFSLKAHAQIDVIKLQASDSSTVGVLAAPFTFKAGANCTWSKSASVVTFNCAGGAGMADPGSNGIITRTALNTTSIATSTDVITMWGVGCNAATWLRGDGACAAPAGGGTVTNALNLGNNLPVVGDGGTTGVKTVSTLGWSLIDKTGSSLADLATRACANLSNGGTLCTSSAALAVTKTAVAGSPLLSYDSTTGAFTQGALTAAQVGALPSGTVLPVTKTAVAGSPLLSYDSTTGAFTQGALTAAQVGALASGTVLAVTKTPVAGSPLLSYDSTTGAFTQAALTAANVGAVPTARTVAGKALSADITIACADLSDDGTACTKNVPASGNAAATEVVLGADTRLSDSRTPTAHTLFGSSHSDVDTAAVSTDDMPVYVTNQWKHTPGPAGGTNGCSGAADKPLYNSTTHLWSCGVDAGSGTVTHTGGNLTLNAVMLGAGVADSKVSTTATDDGTTFSYSGTGGIALTAAGGVGGGAKMAEGTATAGAAGYDVCYADSTAHMVKCNPNNTGAGNVPLVVGATASAGVTIGSGSPIAATSLCSTTVCPAGRYDVHVYIEITTACTTTGSYTPWLGWTDDKGARTGSNTTTYFCGGGLGVTPCTSSAGSILALATTNNFLTGDFFLSTTGAATGGLGSINYGATNGACGSGGPMVGKMFLNVTRLE